MNILAGDIGGTKTLLGLYTYEDRLIRLYHKKYISKQWKSLELIIIDFLDNLPKEFTRPQIGCLGLAGPFHNGVFSITNLDWQIKEQDIINLTGLIKLELVNDVQALIFGIPYLNKNQFLHIQSPKINPAENETIAVISAGTGLGMSKGLFFNNNISAYPSEGGHREFAPRTEKEWMLVEWLKKDLNLQRISIERIVSGTGLGHIARWRLDHADAFNHPLRKVSERWKNKKGNVNDLPALASDAAHNGDELMKEVLEMWLSAYGSAAGDLALQELCHGGLWIAGGATSKQLEGIRSANFLEPFKNKGRFYEFLQNLPVMAIVDQEAGLFSAACRAHMLA